MVPHTYIYIHIYSLSFSLLPFFLHANFFYFLFNLCCERQFLTRREIYQKHFDQVIFRVYIFSFQLFSVFFSSHLLSSLVGYIYSQDAICEAMERPEIPANCPPSLKNLLTDCWSHQYHLRPSFHSIVQR